MATNTESDCEENGKVSEERVLTLMQQIMEDTGRPYVTTQRLSEHLPITPQATGRRLRDLAKEGEIVRDKISANGVIYLFPESSETTSTETDS